MNEWGIPDWHDPANYLGADEWDFDRWRWEFLRRRDDYRKAFDTLAPESHKAWRKRAADFADSGETLPDNHPDPDYFLPPPSINSPRFAAFPAWEEYALFDYIALPNPRYSVVPAMQIQPIHRTLEDHLRLVELPDIDEVWDHVVRPTAILPVGYVAVRFDLRSPIDPQLQGLRAYLAELAKDAGFQPDHRNRTEKWLTYLRVLDGRADGASWADLVLVLPEWISSRTPQSARDTFKQAEQLQLRMWDRAAPRALRD